VPRQTKPKRPNLIKLADSAATLLKAPGGGWTWQTAVDDVAGNAGLTDAERTELYALLEARGCPQPNAGEDADPFETDDGPGDEGPFYDRAKALDDPDEPGQPGEGPDDVVGQIVGPDGVTMVDVPRWATTEPTHAGGDIGHDPVGEDDDTPNADEVLEALDAVEARERAQGPTMDLVGPDQTLGVELQRDADGEPTRVTPGGHVIERRSTRELLAEAEDTARRLRVRLLNEGARERLDDARPIPSEAMRSLEALHPLRKTLRPAVFDQVMTTIVAEIEREWGPIVT
jgi:hypothetical protein